jgi:hypothetical protein
VTTVAEVDRLVQSDDAVAARLWPRLGPKVRDAYLHDRDAWVALRREVAAGKEPSVQDLAAHRKAFAGWARAFHVASRPRKHPPTALPAAATTTAVPAPSLQAAPAASAAAAMALPVAAVRRSTGGAGGAVAGGLVLAGLIAVAVRRKKA